MIITALIYSPEEKMIDVETDFQSCDYQAVARRVQEKVPNCHRVILLRDGEFAYDTNDCRN